MEGDMTIEFTPEAVESIIEVLKRLRHDAECLEATLDLDYADASIKELEATLGNPQPK